jgi:hypothetical protein
MAMLNFSAEASLYVSSGHYRTGEQALSSFREMNRLRPAVGRGEVPPDVIGHEVINVVGYICPPGWTDLGGGACWPPPLTESPSGGGESPGTPGVPVEGGPPGPGVGGPPEWPEPQQKPPKKRRFNPTEGGKCYADEIRGDKAIFVPKGKYTRLPGDIWFCCDPKPPNECIQCQPEGKDDGACANGWPLG